jgi:hypothetical protein
MDELVQHLSYGDHPVVIGGPQPSLSELRKRLEEIGLVFVKFTDTDGGTELGVRVDKSTVHTSQADFSEGRGMVHVEGSLTLNYIKVRCIADIDLATLSGTGHLVVVEEVKAYLTERND